MNQPFFKPSRRLLAVKFLVDLVSLPSLYFRFFVLFLKMMTRVFLMFSAGLSILFLGTIFSTFVVLLNIPSVILFGRYLPVTDQLNFTMDRIDRKVKGFRANR